MTLGGTFSILTSSKKIISFIMQTLETQVNPALLLAGGIGWLLIIGGVAFVVVKYRLVRLLIKKPNQVKDS